MRLGVLADIHGNLLALEAVLDRLRTLGCDAIINLGDCLSGPLQAGATADRLMAERLLTVRGNHDRQLVDRDVSAMGPSDRAALELLRPAHLDWLRSLPFDAVFEDLYLCHATPDSDLQYLLERVTDEGNVVLAAPNIIRERLGSHAPRVVLHGHTHIPRMVRVQDSLLINPGSVGLPAYDDDAPVKHYMETGSPHARFAVLDQARGQWTAAFHAIGYNWDAASKLAAERGRPDWAHALATGFALRP